MNRAPSIAVAAGVLTVVSVALAGLLWLMPSPVGESVREPAGPALPHDARADTTGSIGAAPAARDDEPEAVAATAPSAPAPAAAPAPATAASMPAAPAITGLVLSRDGDVVTLAGTVDDPAVRAAVVEAARARFVTQPIVDRLSVAETAPTMSADVAGVALSALARLAEGEARLDGTALAIEGRALYSQAATRIAEEIGTRLPEGWTTRLSIDTPPPQPEPIVAALPASTPTPAASAPAAPLADGVVRDAAAGTSPALAFVNDLPRPLPATLADIDRHPLPPRR